MIAKLGIQHSILKLCQMLDVARSGYQAWRNGKSSLRKQDDLRLLAHIRAAHVRGRETYGAQKIQAELKDAGIEIGITRIKRYVRLQVFVASTNVNLKSPQILNTNCQLHLTCLTVNLIKPLRLIKYG
jgi:hypothetical protein